MGLLTHPYAPFTHTSLLHSPCALTHSPFSILTLQIPYAQSPLHKLTHLRYTLPHQLHNFPTGQPLPIPVCNASRFTALAPELRPVPALSNLSAQSFLHLQIPAHCLTSHLRPIRPHLQTVHYTALPRALSHATHCNSSHIPTLTTLSGGSTLV